MKEDVSYSMSYEYINTSEFDTNFKFEVTAAHKSASELNACLACGTCAAGCPIHKEYSEYNPMKMVRMIKFGMKKDILSSRYIWYCTTCRTCEHRCPQKVNFFSILNVIKNMSAREGFAAPQWVKHTKQLLKTGIVIPTEESWVKKREELSLRPLKGKGEKLAKIIKLVGLDKIEAGWQL